MTGYIPDIIGILHCTPADAELVEDMMRNEVFHSTLDWQTADEFRRGAKKAWHLLQGNREDYEALNGAVKAEFWVSPTGKAALKLSHVNH